MAGGSKNNYAYAASTERKNNMDNKFLLSCESTLDLPYSYTTERGIPVIFYTYVLDGTEHEDNMGRDPKVSENFYRSIYDGKLPTTSLVTEHRYEEYFEGLLQSTELPILHLAFSSGLTPSVRKAMAAAENVKQRYPDRRLEVIDTMCGGSGLGLLAELTADLRDEGKSIDEALEWVNENRFHVQHEFFSTDLKYLRRSGRVSGAVAMIATVLGICPIMKVIYDGKIIAYEKVRGKRHAIRRIVDAMEKHCGNPSEYSTKCYVGHSDCPEDAERMKQEILDRFPLLTVDSVRIVDIGTILASHCGPGTVAVFFMGDERKAESED